MSEHAWEADLEDKSDREIVIKNMKTPWPKTLAELNNLIHSALSGTHTYGSVVEAMGFVSAATLNYMGSELGVSGFQASAADLVTLRRNRLLEGPFAIMKLDDVFYPQYNMHDKMNEFISECSEWISTEAKKKLEQTQYAHPDVVKRWELLAKCEGNDTNIIKVLSGMNPFAEFDYETTDCEASDEEPKQVESEGCCEGVQGSNDNSCVEEEAPPLEALKD